eukprot:8601351-Lingulodinium_polyedra.AAC.1
MHLAGIWQWSSSIGEGLSCWRWPGDSRAPGKHSLVADSTIAHNCVLNNVRGPKQRWRRRGNAPEQNARRTAL